MTKLLADNPHGLCLLMDELMAWIYNFTRYNRNSSEEEFWIKLFNGILVLSDRKDSCNSFALGQPNVNVIGGIQTKLLSKLIAGNKGDNGFIDRIIFVMANNTKAPKVSDSELPTCIDDEWRDFCLKLLQVSGIKDDDNRTNVLEFTHEAKLRYIAWQNYNADLQDQETDDDIAGMYAKLDY